jgi:hypothetical protein
MEAGIKNFKNHCHVFVFAGVAAALKLAAAGFFVCVWFLLRWSGEEELVSAALIAWKIRFTALILQVLEQGVELAGDEGKSIKEDAMRMEAQALRVHPPERESSEMYTESHV